MEDTDSQLFTRLKAEDPEFASLAQEHRRLDQQIGAFDRIYYLTSEQERKQKDLREQKQLITDQLYGIMRQHVREAALPRG